VGGPFSDHFYYKLTVKFEGEVFFKVREHLQKLSARSLTV